MLDLQPGWQVLQQHRGGGLVDLLPTCEPRWQSRGSLAYAQVLFPPPSIAVSASASQEVYTGPDSVLDWGH